MWYTHDPTVFGYEAVFNGYMNWMQNVTSVKAYQVLPGNHEADCYSPICLNSTLYRDALSNFTAYNARFRMPAAESGGWCHGELAGWCHSVVVLDCVTGWYLCLRFPAHGLPRFLAPWLPVVLSVTGLGVRHTALTLAVTCRSRAWSRLHRRRRREHVVLL